MTKNVDLNLDLIAPSLRVAAVDDLEQDNVLGFLIKSERGNTDWLAIVYANASPFRERGLYEQALLHAWDGTRTNHASAAAVVLALLCASADKAKLRAQDRGPATPAAALRPMAGRAGGFN